MEPVQMQQEGHTPGPWEVVDIREPGEDRILIYQNFMGGKFIADVVTLADARLIAAAPELLAALKHIIDDMLDEDEANKIARAAIARAEGVTP